MTAPFHVVAFGREGVYCLHQPDEPPQLRLAMYEAKFMAGGFAHPRVWVVTFERGDLREDRCPTCGRVGFRVYTEAVPVTPS